MNPNEMLKVLSGELAQRMAVSVRTSGNTDERPTPVVIVDNYALTNLNFHNDHYVGSEHSSGTETNRWYRFHYDARVDMVVRHNDDVQAHSLLSALQSQLALIATDPRTHLHDDIDSFEMGTSGEISYQYREPQETELNQTVTLRSFHDVNWDTFDTVAEIQDTFTIEN